MPEQPPTDGVLSDPAFGRRQDDGETPIDAVRGCFIRSDEALPEQVGFLVVPDFSMMSFISALEALRAANRLAGRELYRWLLISASDHRVEASNGIDVIAHATIDEIDFIPSVFVCTGADAYRYEDSRLFSWLRRISRRGAVMGGLSTGSYILARAGLLDGYRCTIHWQSYDAFREAFPRVEVTQELFEIDRDRMTGSGGTASLDMFLHLIARRHGHKLAAEIAENFVHDRIREAQDKQRMTLRARTGVSHPRLLAAIEAMECHIEDPLTQSDLAAVVGLSPRQLERLFRRYLNETPTRYYLELRLQRARRLLLETSLSVLDVAMCCGFVSASHFSKCYRNFFKRTPRQERLSE